MSGIDESLSSLRARARVAVIGIYIFILFSIARGAIGVADLAGAISLNALPSQSYLNAFYFVTYGSLAVFYGTALAVAFWIFRAHKNLFDAGYDKLEFTPGRSVGWFFVPVASLYMPYKAMKELWHFSVGEESDASRSGPSLLLIWWSSYLVGNVVDWMTALVAGFARLSLFHGSQ